MYAALLVDDEQTILTSLQENISWQQLGVDRLFTAADGLMALDILEREHIDLMITDIRMPHMDGLSLLKQVRSRYPEIHCILLTAYSEFEYARAAIQLGVENYLLKPFQQDELEATIEKALDNLYRSYSNSRDLFVNNVLFRWASGSITPDELAQRAAMLKINIYLSEYCVVCALRRGAPVSLSAWLSACAARLKGSCEIYPFWDREDRYVLILGGSDLALPALTRIFAEVGHETGMDQKLVLAFGPAVADSELLPQSYQAACSLLDTADFSRFPQAILTPETGKPQETIPLISELSRLFHMEDAEAREQQLHALTVQLFSAPADEQEALATLIRCLLQLFQQEFPDVSGIQKRVFTRAHLIPSDAGRAALTAAAEDLLQYACLMFRYHFDNLSPVVRLLIQTVQEHFGDSLSLKEFCVKNKMSTAYLGYLFKKETGMFFNNYLAQFRICRSARLLLDSEKSIHEIAAETGFASTTYYNYCFKKYTGLTPIRYRALKSVSEVEY